MLWEHNVYPFTDQLFMYDGYAIHVVGGVGYASFQTAATLLCVSARFTPLFFTTQAITATVVLGIVELLQFYDPTRHVQLGDMIAQTFGICFALVLLYLLELKRVRKLPA